MTETERRAAVGSALLSVDELHSFTSRDLASAFTEWERRYREEPDRFQSEATKLLRETPESYGEACAPYLIALLKGDL